MLSIREYHLEYERITPPVEKATFIYYNIDEAYTKLVALQEAAVADELECTIYLYTIEMKDPANDLMQERRIVSFDSRKGHE